MERPNILSVLKTEVVALQAADSEKVYAHRGLVDNVVGGVGGCSWPCFTGATVTGFVEYLYQGNYTTPPAVATIRKSSHISSLVPESLDYEKVFLTHAGLFILSQRYKMLPLASMSLKRLREAMKEAQDGIRESILVENLRVLIRYSYNPCCSGNVGAWEELQKVVSEFLASKGGWLLSAPGSDLIVGEKLAKDILARAINLLIEKDKFFAVPEELIEDLKVGCEKTEIKSRGKKKKKTRTSPKLAQYKYTTNSAGSTDITG